MGYIVNIELKRVLGLEGYVPSKFTPGLFTHKTRDIAFSLVVDDFGVRYTKREDVEHLLKTIQVRYSIKNRVGSNVLLRSDIRIQLR